MSATHTLYRIWYGENLVYLGRTNQKLQSRLRGHFFGRPMHRKLDLKLVTKIERAEFATEADMFVYEVYFINLYKPYLNRDDLSYSDLTVSLPDVKWEEFVPPRMEAWREEIEQRDVAYEKHRKEADALFAKACEERRNNPELSFELRRQAEKLWEKEW